MIECFDADSITAYRSAGASVHAKCAAAVGEGSPSVGSGGEAPVGGLGSDEVPMQKLEHSVYIVYRF